MNEVIETMAHALDKAGIKLVKPIRLELEIVDLGAPIHRYCSLLPKDPTT